MAKTAFPECRGRRATRSPTSQMVKEPPEPEKIIETPEETSHGIPGGGPKLRAAHPRQVLSLQQTVGNQAVGHLLQRSSPEGQTRRAKSGFWPTRGAALVLKRKRKNSGQAKSQE